jgi:CelD/BcsL family acetyltransferase involved in cellulose biosynthesis
MRATVEPIRDAESFLDEWRSFRPYQNLFLTDAWIGALLDIWPQASERFAIRVRDSDGAPRLLGLIGRARRRHPFALRAARLNESDNAAIDRIYIEFNDFLVQKSEDAPRRVALAAIADAFAKDDELIFRNATPQLAAAITAHFGASGLAASTLREEPTFEVDLAAAPSFSKSMRKKLSVAEQAYSERGAVSVARITHGSEFDEAFDRLTQLHGETWRRRGEHGVFVNESMIAFHRAFWRRAPEMTELLEVRAGEDVIAVLYNFVFEDFAANYQSGLRFENNNRFAPGFLAHALAIKEYRTRGLKTYSFLAGDAEYKRRMGVEGPRLATMVVSMPSWRQKARSIVKQFGARRGAGTRQT